MMIYGSVSRRLFGKTLILNQPLNAPGSTKTSDLILITSLSSLCLLVQTLLKNNATASFFHAQLAGTDWTVADVSNFLAKKSEDPQPPGSAITWRDVFNETDQAIMSISRFMEVSRLPLMSSN